MYYHDLPPQNTTHIRSCYHAGHKSNTKSTPIFSNNFFKLVEGSGHNDYRKPISAIDSADAIVVLSGMLEINEVGDSIYIEWGDPDRFFGGIALFKAGKAQKLVFSLKILLFQMVYHPKRFL